MLSIVQLMGEHDLYEYYRDDYKVHGTSWNQNKSRQILEAWQRAFIQVVSQFCLLLSVSVSAAS